MVGANLAERTFYMRAHKCAVALSLYYYTETLECATKVTTLYRFTAPLVGVAGS